MIAFSYSSTPPQARVMVCIFVQGMVLKGGGVTARGGTLLPPPPPSGSRINRVPTQGASLECNKDVDKNNAQTYKTKQERHETRPNDEKQNKTKIVVALFKSVISRIFSANSRTTSPRLSFLWVSQTGPSCCVIGTGPRLGRD